MDIHASPEIIDNRPLPAPAAFGPTVQARLVENTGATYVSPPRHQNLPVIPARPLRRRVAVGNRAPIPSHVSRRLFY